MNEAPVVALDPRRMASKTISNKLKEQSTETRNGALVEDMMWHNPCNLFWKKRSSINN